MRPYPIQLTIEGRRCVVVGAGAVAERRVEGLLACGASVVVLAPHAAAAIAAHADQGRLHWIQEAYRADMLDGAFVVIAATNDPAVNQAVIRDAEERRLLHCSADSAATGNFTTPAQVIRGDLIVTVSTGGESPTLSSALRARLEEEFGPEWAPLTKLLGGLRERVQALGAPGDRQAAVRRLIDDVKLRGFLRDGEWDDAQERAEALLRRL